MRTHVAADKARPGSAEGMAAALVQELTRRRYSSSTLQQAHQVLPRFLSHLRERGRRDLRAMMEQDIDAYARALARRKTRDGRPLALATQLHHLSMIRRFFRFLVRRRWILQDPTKDLVLPRHDSLPRAVLSLSQARKLMSAPHRYHGRWWWPHVEKRDHAILELLYGTGIRRGECIRLDIADLDLLEGQVLIRNGKGKKDRVVPIPARTADSVDTYLRESRPAFVKDPRVSALFTSWMGERLKPVTLVAMLKQRGKAARVTLPLSPHVLRHTCATHLLQGGADVRHVQEILGHADLDSTMRYTRVAVTDLAKVIDRCHPREQQWRQRTKRTQ